MGQDRLANEVWCEKRHIRRIEKGKRFPSMPLFKKLLNILDISTINLLEKMTEQD